MPHYVFASPTRTPASSRNAVRVLLLAIGVWGFASTAGAQPAPDSAKSLPSETTAARDTAEAVVPGVATGELVDQLLKLGFENITVSADGRRVAYENRRYRHPMTALGLIARTAGDSVLVFERRLGLAAGAVPIGGDSVPPSRLALASDGNFPLQPSGPRARATHRSVDLLVGPLMAYELPRIYSPALVRWDIQPELRWNPWPGGRMRAAVVIPLENQLGTSPENPDVDQVRPGPVLLEQYGWSKGAALFSATAGLLGNNRYGISMGVARPLLAGQILLDAQTDFTGFIAFADSGSTFSTPDRSSGFIGVTYRPPRLDLGVRLRAARFLRGDEGLELEIKRSMGDFDVALYGQKIRGLTIIEEDGSTRSPLIGGVRITLPLPPITRPVGPRVRVLPVDRFTLTYSEESSPTGQFLANVASREDYLRYLDLPSIRSNHQRYDDAYLGVKRRDLQPIRWVSLMGTTGFVNTPWVGVMGDREIEFGYNQYPKEASYFGQPGSDPLHPDKSFPNEVYYASLGFLPRVEVGLRWTVVPGYHPFEDIAPESKTVYSDRMFSGRLEVIKAKPGRPGFAIGVDDLRGTRRFHSSYGVIGLPWDIYHLQNRVTLGYAPRAFEASRWVLDGLFGAAEVTFRRSVAVALEHDTEKWNTMLGINLGFGLRARAALLDLEHLGIGVGWHTAL